MFKKALPNINGYGTIINAQVPGTFDMFTSRNRLYMFPLFQN